MTSDKANGSGTIGLLASAVCNRQYRRGGRQPYTDLGADWLAGRNDEAHARRLVAQLESLGHTVVLDPVT
ncbi:hypothetical protein [Modestobacter marinus]|uniref:hypothetical protein n=1 Tax=Modestobacter marinus TaxID=477641 RepID=UPI001C98ADC1|nr:hypothetical protein [Modestobacter marinus]